MNWQSQSFRCMVIFAERTEWIKLSIFTAVFNVQSDGDPGAWNDILNF